MAQDQGPEDPPDRLSLRDHLVEVEIGAFQAERGVRQRLSFNVVVELHPVTGPVEDDVDRILSYDRITEAIAAELAVERFNLLETLAERIAARVLREPRALRIFLRIEKLDRGPGALGVEIVRSAVLSASDPAPLGDVAPVAVAFLSNAALSTAGISALVDRLHAKAQETDNACALILCVDLPDLPAPESLDPQARWRIDLLALEQNAWSLAGRVPRCVVVDSRTELDWAIKNDQISLWAPSRIVLDTPDAPQGCVDAMDLAIWFARHMQARHFISVGAEVSEKHRHEGLTIHMQGV